MRDPPRCPHLCGASVVLKATIARQPVNVVSATLHIELKNARNHDDGLRPIPILVHREAERGYAIGEKSAAHATLVLNDPVSVGVLAHQKERRPRTRGNFCSSHGGSP